jgi:hypothetical protein
MKNKKDLVKNFLEELEASYDIAIENFLNEIDPPTIYDAIHEIRDGIGPENIERDIIILQAIFDLSRALSEMARKHVSNEFNIEQNTFDEDNKKSHDEKEFLDSIFWVRNTGTPRLR